MARDRRYRRGAPKGYGWNVTHEHGGYGFFPGGDPRKFTPDADGNTPGEIEAHKRACAEWDRGDETKIAGGCQPGTLHDAKTGEQVGAIIVCGSSLGMGSYTWECDDPDCPEAGRGLGSDPEDAYAAFERWMGYEGGLLLTELEPGGMQPKDALREAFAAGFKAREQNGAEA